MSTLVLCVDRSNDIGRKAGLPTPVVGWEAVRSLVTDVGLADPEDSNVNCLLEALRVSRDLRDEKEDSIVAVVSGVNDTLVGADRSLAAQVDALVDEYDPESAIVVVDSASDERVVPVIESRLRIDSVDRVVVRQAHDIESTYYLLKQFLADEELRSTILVPLGATLLLMPLLLTRFEPQLAFAVIGSVLGAALLYKGLAIDQLLAESPERIRDALYSGQVSIVTYVVAAGLTLVGAFLGALSVTPLTGSGTSATLISTMQFIYHAVPWLALAALTASAGRLLDELIGTDGVSRQYLNLPFGIVALGLVVRGFAGWFLQREGILSDAVLFSWALSARQRLALFIVGGIVVSVIGVRIAATMSENETLEEAVEQ
ncbi:hypothetical protein C499_16747 [Halogeometricum borinquense DSM 11551]|uniref:Predicted membrane protein n=2 Tax=Halogeometricum borinquense TaxID=60847 RepID=E4NQV2_HALBP|nr:DUF373 family protein [Halogeometricum borinquense]ADQ67899.1 predicted membrane protein [Halogeometricum borinquense DSM 11551]ELY24181.1 hypothetical protein C499_16747 [Halogeometricum borinquense DSM 11551]RYJ13200.1 DUF373 family protein [Halogeometricum borinquense]